MSVELHVAAIREAANLPISDLAAMMGINRRQFYDLLHGVDSGFDRGELICAVSRSAQLVVDALDGDRDKAASALLAPILDGDSFFDRVNKTKDPQVARQAGQELLARIKDGAVIGHRVPPSLRSNRDPERIEARFDNSVGTY